MEKDKGKARLINLYPFKQEDDKVVEDLVNLGVCIRTARVPQLCPYCQRGEIDTVVKRAISTIQRLQEDLSDKGGGE